MRKKALKKHHPNRREAIKYLRENHQYNHYGNGNGTTTYLNFMKHLLFATPYRNEEYKKDFGRFTNSFLRSITRPQKGEE